MMMLRLAFCGALTLAATPDRSAAGINPKVSANERKTIERTLTDLEEQWIGVYVTHDLALLERLIADDFVATLSDGEMRGKREHIAAYPRDFETWAQVVASDLKVNVYTAEAAVVTGLYTATLRRPEGAEKSQRYRFTDTWLRRIGAWQCVATQETRID